MALVSECRFAAPPRRMQNLRDVGGISTYDGERVRAGVLLRGDAPYAGDVEPEQIGWPPALVIDLRSPGEGDDPHPLAGPATEIVAVPLLRAANAVEASLHDNVPSDLEAIYDEILDVPGSLVEVLRLIARAPAPVLVHCSAGKDRTGVVVALTLAAVGARRDEIVADYVRTDPNMSGVVSRYGARLGQEDRAYVARLLEARSELLTAPARAIERVLDAAGGRAGGIERWLLQQGLGRSDLAALRHRLVVRR